MAKKQNRSMDQALAAQEQVEKEHSDRFKDAKQLIEPKESKSAKAKPVRKDGRKNPQVSCTIEEDDAVLLKDIRMHLINKHKDPTITQSMVIRRIIRLANSQLDSI